MEITSIDQKETPNVFRIKATQQCGNSYTTISIFLTCTDQTTLERYVGVMHEILRDLCGEFNTLNSLQRLPPSYT